MASKPSRRQSREDIQNGAISINGEKVTDLEFEWTKEQSFEERFVIVRREEKNTSPGGVWGNKRLMGGSCSPYGGYKAKWTRTVVHF